MALLILIPFLVQAFAITFDEYYFHIKRGLPLWERVGHPLDTLSLIICFVFILVCPFSETNLKWYIGLCVFSCLMVTKDEWVHKHHCPASEQWLHALLFINHPIMLSAAGVIWWALSGTNSWVSSWLNHPEMLKTMLVVQTGSAGIFFLYQVIYWNVIWKEKIKKQ